MKISKILTVMFLVLIAASNVYSQTRFSSEEMSGGSMVTNLGYNIKVNDGSTLQRKWFIINDNTCPIRLEGAGINTSYNDSKRRYEYGTSGGFETKDGISALEIRFLLFDVWNEHMTTLSFTVIKDLPISKYQISSLGKFSWYAFESDVSELYTVVSFVARVRKPDGSKWHYDIQGLEEQTKSIKIQLNKQILLPTKEKGSN